MAASSRTTRALLSVGTRRGRVFAGRGPIVKGRFVVEAGYVLPTVPGTTSGMLMMVGFIPRSAGARVLIQPSGRIHPKIHGVYERLHPPPPSTSYRSLFVATRHVPLQITAPSMSVHYHPYTPRLQEVRFKSISEAVLYAGVTRTRREPPAFLNARGNVCRTCVRAPKTHLWVNGSARPRCATPRTTTMTTRSPIPCVRALRLKTPLRPAAWSPEPSTRERCSCASSWRHKWPAASIDHPICARALANMMHL